MELLNYFINNYNLYIFCYFFIANFFIYTIYEPFKQKIILAYPKFKTYDQSRQNYIIKNLMKAMALYFISILSIPVIPAFLFNYQKFNIIIQLTGVFYAANDFVGLLKVKNSPLIILCSLSDKNSSCMPFSPGTIRCNIFFPPS